MQQPSVGRSVHFTSESGECRHAVILEVNDSMVVLEVHPPRDDNYKVEAHHSDGPWLNHWHWPERV